MHLASKRLVSTDASISRARAPVGGNRDSAAIMLGIFCLFMDIIVQKVVYWSGDRGHAFLPPKIHLPINDGGSA
jgi:hypothetical protein